MKGAKLRNMKRLLMPPIKNKISHHSHSDYQSTITHLWKGLCTNENRSKSFVRTRCESLCLDFSLRAASSGLVADAAVFILESTLVVFSN